MTNYQVQATTDRKTVKDALSEANDKLAQAKKDTPAHLHKYFRGGIRFAGKGQFEYYWILR